MFRFEHKKKTQRSAVHSGNICSAFRCILHTSFTPPPKKNGTLHLILLDDDNSLELMLAEDQTIKGWETEGIVYFFVPSYVSATQVVLDSPCLAWQSVRNAKSALQYDSIQTLLFCNQAEEVTDFKKICFKHSANLHTIYLDLKGHSPDSLPKDAFVETDVKVIDPQGMVTYNESGNSIKAEAILPGKRKSGLIF